MKKRIEEFMNTIDADDKKIVTRALNSCYNYINTVMEHVTLRDDAHCISDSKSRSVQLQELDKIRHFAHETMMADIKVVNRLATKIYQQPALFNIKEDAKREEYGALAFEIVNTYFR